jgi:hypothetical protein
VSTIYVVFNHKNMEWKVPGRSDVSRARYGRSKFGGGWVLVHDVQSTPLTSLPIFRQDALVPHDKCFQTSLMYTMSSRSSRHICAV